MSSPAKASKGGQTNPLRWKPGWQTYYTIGHRAQKRLPKFKTLEEIGQELGISKQNAYTETLVALGKFLYHLVRAVGEIPDL